MARRPSAFTATLDENLDKRRRHSGLADPKEHRGVLLMAFALPKLARYVERDDLLAKTTNAAETGKAMTTILQAFEGAVEDAAEFNGGALVGSMFSVMVVRFRTLRGAIDGALHVNEEMEKFTSKQREESSQRTILNFKATQPLAILTDAKQYGFHNERQEAHKPRVCSEELFFYRMIPQFSDEAIQLPAIRIPLAMLNTDRQLRDAYDIVPLPPDAHSGEKIVNVLRLRPDALLVDEEADPYKTALKNLPRDVRKAWLVFDINEDSSLQRDEVHQVLNSLDYGLTEWQIDDFFDEMDTDCSGTISVVEFAASFRGPILGCAAIIRDCKLTARKLAEKSGVDTLPLLLEMWNRYDTSGDGTLDSDELHCVLLDMGVEVTSKDQIGWLLTKIDEDDSGVVEFNEFADLVSAPHGHGGINPIKLAIIEANRAAEPPLIVETEDQRESSRKMRMNLWVETYFVFVLFIYIVYHSARATYRIFSRNIVDDDTPQAIIDWVTDLIYLGWVMIKWRHLPWERGGYHETETSKVLHAYIRSPDFVVDLIVLLPIDIAYWADPNRASFGFYRINKVFSMYYLNWSFEKATSSISPTIAAVIRTIVWFCVCVHIWACIFLEIASHLGSDEMRNVFEVEELIEDTEILYIRSLFWSILTLAGQIGADGIPYPDIQVLLLLLASLTGLPLYAMLLFTFSAVVEMHTSENVMKNRLDTLLGVASYLEFDRDTTKQAFMYYRYLFNTMGTTDLQYQLPEDLPPELRIRMNIEVGRQFLERVPIFEPVLKLTMAPALINEIVTRMETRVVEQDTEMSVQGGKCDGMYFVQWGLFHGENIEGDVVLTKEFRRGDYFGEMELLLGIRNAFTVKSGATRDGFATVAIFSKADFEEVMKRFPEALDIVVAQANERYRELQVERELQALSNRKQELEESFLGNDAEKAEKLRELEMEEEKIEASLRQASQQSQSWLHKAVVSPAEVDPNSDASLLALEDEGTSGNQQEEATRPTTAFQGMSGDGGNDERRSETQTEAFLADDEEVPEIALTAHSGSYNSPDGERDDATNPLLGKESSCQVEEL